MQCRGRFARDASAAPTREARDRAFRSIWPMRGSRQARAADRLLFRRNHADQMTTSHSAAHQSDRVSTPQTTRCDPGTAVEGCVALQGDRGLARDTRNWTLRAIAPADETALIEFHDRCSKETQYLRFGGAKPQLRPAEAHYLCAVDDHLRGALVIIDADDPWTIHGVGRWEQVDLTDAELAFVIEDAYQGRGLGRKLVEATIERAHEEGFARLVTAVLPSNYRMRHLARDYDLVVARL